MYIQEAKDLWSKVYTTSEDEIAIWLENPFTDFVPCSDVPQTEREELSSLRDNFHRSRGLKDFACFIIAAPLGQQFTAKTIAGQNFDIPLDETQKLTREVEDLKRRTVLGKIDQDGLLDTVFAQNFGTVLQSLRNFMEQKAVKAKEILIIFLGHGNMLDESQGTMCFQEERQPITNAALFEAVKMYQDENSLLGSAFSVVLTQCFSHLGIDALLQEPNLTVTALTSETRPCPEVEINQCVWYVDTRRNIARHLPFERDTALYARFGDYYKTGHLIFPVVKAERTYLVNWLNAKYNIPAVPTDRQTETEVNLALLTQAHGDQG